MLHFSQCFNSTRSLTEQMLDKTLLWNTNKTGNLVGRWVVSRGMGSLGVAVASLIDAIREVFLTLLTAGCVVSNRANIKAIDVGMHLRKAARHVVGAVAALGLGAIAPNELLIPFMAKVGFDIRLQGTLLNRIAKIASKTITKRTVLMGAGLVGLTLAAHSYGFLPALNVFKTPPTSTEFPYPSLHQIGLFIGLSHYIAYNVQGPYAPISGHPDLIFYEQAAELPILNVGTSPVRLVGCGLLFLANTMCLLKKQTRAQTKTNLKEIAGAFGRSCVQALPLLGNAAALYSHNIRRSVGRDNYHLREAILMAEKPSTPSKEAQCWLDALKAVQAERSIQFNDWIKTLRPLGQAVVKYSVLYLLVDDKGRQWYVVMGDVQSRPVKLIPYPLDDHGQFQIVMNAAQDVLTEHRNFGSVSLTAAEGRQLRTHLDTCPNMQTISANFFTEMDRVLGAKEV